MAIKPLVIPSIFTAVDRASGPVDKMSRNIVAKMDRIERKMRKVSRKSFDVARNAARFGAAIVLPIALLANSAIKFEDKMADVAKTTGLADKELVRFGKDILTVSKDTRSSIDDLIQIGVIGGQMSVAKDELLDFTKAADKFNVALGTDFAGGTEEAILQIAKIQSLFAQTKFLDISEGISRTGSAINDITAAGTSAAPAITNFIQRIGATDEALRPSIQNAIALGALFDEAAIASDAAARGLSILLTAAAKNAGAFGKQMELTKKASEEMINRDSIEFVQKFANSIKDLKATESAKLFKKLGIAADGTKKVLSVLSSESVRFVEIQGDVKQSFIDNTSLLDEYNVKNNTAAARIEKAKNKFKVLSITLGNTLIPIMTTLIDAISPMLEKFAAWVELNKPLVSKIARASLVIAGLAFAISAVAGAIGIATKATLIYTNVVKGLVFITEAMAAAQAIWDAMVAASPIGAFVIAAIAAFAVVKALTAVFKKQTTTQRANNAVAERVLENTIDQRVENTLLFRTLRIAKEGSDSYNKTLERLEELQPGIIDKFDLQVKSLTKIKEAEDELTKSILKRALASARTQIIEEKLAEAFRIEQEGPSFADKFFGGLDAFATAEAFQGARAKELRDQVDVLIKQQVDDESKLETVNPKAVDQEIQSSLIEKRTTEEIRIIFENLPFQAKIIGNAGINFLQTSLGSTAGQ